MKKKILSLLIASLFMVSSCGGSNNGKNNPGTNDPSNPSTPSEGGQEVDPEDPGDPANPGDDPVNPGDDPVDPGDDPVDPGDDPSKDLTDEQICKIIGETLTKKNAVMEIAINGEDDMYYKFTETRFFSVNIKADAGVVMVLDDERNLNFYDGESGEFQFSQPWQTDYIGRIVDFINLAYITDFPLLDNLSNFKFIKDGDTYSVNETFEYTYMPDTQELTGTCSGISFTITDGELVEFSYKVANYEDEYNDGVFSFKLFKVGEVEDSEIDNYLASLQPEIDLEGTKYTFASGSFEPIEGQTGPSEDLINSQYEGVFMNVYPDTEKEGEGYMQLFFPMVYGSGESGSGSDTRLVELNYVIYNCTYTLNEDVYEVTILFMNVAGQSIYSPEGHLEMSFTISNESLTLRATSPGGIFIFNFVNAGEADPYLILEAPKDIEEDNYEGYDKYEFHDAQFEEGYEDYAEMYIQRFEGTEFYYNEKSNEFIHVVYEESTEYSARTRYFGSVVSYDEGETYWLHCDKIDVYVSGMSQELEQDMDLSPVVIGEGTVSLIITYGLYDEANTSFTVVVNYKLVSE